MRWDLTTLINLQAMLDAALREYEAHCYEAQQQTKPGQWHVYWGDEANYARWFRASALRRVQAMIDFAHGRRVEVLQQEPQGKVGDEDISTHAE